MHWWTPEYQPPWSDVKKQTGCIICRGSWRECRWAAKLLRIQQRIGQNVLSRTARYIRANHYLIARDYNGQVVGVIGLIIWAAGLIEVVSHVIDSKHRHQGIGTQLLNHAIKEAKKFGYKSLFLCTTETEYYQQLGFMICGPSKYTEKIRRDCQDCPKGPFGPGYAPCPEIAMELNLTD